MFSRIQAALGLTLLWSLIIPATVFAKGNFSFITIAGPNLKEPIRSTDPALTTDFFAFADFSQHSVKAPENPGVGYEITSYYTEGASETAFDRLHYYPDSGYVHFDGFVNGSSEYDGKWYIAKTDVKEAFLNALPAAIVAKPQVVEEATQIQPSTSNVSEPARMLTGRPLMIMSIVTVTGLVILGFILRRRKASVQ